MRRQQQDGQSSVFYELSCLVLSILRSPPPLPPSPFPDHPSRRPTLTPAGFASLLLGVSMALMLCGSVTFFIGFLMMPWVIIGLVLFFYFAAVVSSLSFIGRLIFYCAAAPPAPRKDISAWKLM